MRRGGGLALGAGRNEPSGAIDLLSLFLAFLSTHVFRFTSQIVFYGGVWRCLCGILVWVFGQRFSTAFEGIIHVLNRKVTAVGKSIGLLGITGRSFIQHIVMVDGCGLDKGFRGLPKKVLALFSTAIMIGLDKGSRRLPKE